MGATTPLPADGLVLTDGGLETTLIFHEGMELPAFAAFPLVESEDGRRSLRRYYGPYLEVARARGTGFVVGTPTWRANPDWGAELGFDLAALERANRASVVLAREVAAEAAALGVAPVLVEGVLGPRGDGYAPGEKMAAGEAAAYHGWQVGVLADAGVDLVSVLTVPYVEEGIGVARAAAERGVPCVVSFTVETDGRLPSGQPLGEAVEQLDAETGASALHVMVNCAHPSHLAPALEGGGAWQARIGGLRANASRSSHAELDEAEQLDEGDPAELGAEHEVLRQRLPAVRVLGGCCGTDVRHVDAVSAAWLRAATAP